MSKQSRSRRATAADVARMARTSRATVSYVLNNTPGQTISPPTRQRVLNAAANLGYTPNSLARDLAAGHSRVVVIAMPPIPSTYKLGEYYQQLGSIITHHGFTSLMWYENQQLTASLLQTITPALVVAPYGLNDEDRTLFASLAIPCVEGRDLHEQVDFDAGSSQVRHLIERGSRRIVVVTTDNPIMQIFAAPRAEGARKAALDAGLGDIPALTLPLPTDDNVSTLVRTTHEFLDANPEVDAFACYNDVHAMPVMQALLERDVKIPDSVRIVGIDDELFSAYLPVPLTTFALTGDPTTAHMLGSGLAALGVSPCIEKPDAPFARLIQRGSS